ncbi:apolipoprotein N-acyltransferase [Hymenobacter ginsengisoli]|uniref:Apolipoprotein N-acyltransferase n=2 Tax=Hymenobacter ginsengisoli TaxID=1051626 RepID=A0ABP8QC06_9BACT|nr:MULTISPECIES: apolipoprotein N-acyltransferase [unclassified Hymenobacter]MBO2032037.1 apolipoprotein N-acyltransferase [Hymenobacter sp. BT559]
MTPTPSGPLGRLGQSPPLLALLGAALLWAAWPVHPAPFALLLFVGFVPYLRLEQVLTAQGARRGRVFAFTYLFLVLWNAFTTWWVSYSTLGGGIAAVVLNAALMCLPLLAFRRTKQRFGTKIGYLSLPVYWIAFEQLHLTWDLSWPWLTLGNGFASATSWVQWYEYTGFLGGSLWVLSVNVLVFWAWFGTGGVRPWTINGPRRWRCALPMLAIWLPITVSLTINHSFQEKGPGAEVVVIQPNIDPYEAKFPGTANFIPFNEQLTRLLARTEAAITPETRLVLWPETALDEVYLEATFNQSPQVARIRQELLARHPGLSLLTGITSAGTYPDAAHASPTARHRDDAGYYDVFNTAAYFADASAPVQFYHKSKLVPGVEKIPPVLSSVLSNIDLGGVVGSYGSQDERTVFPPAPGAPALRLAPLICYESIYGDFAAQYVRNGATLFGLITNDGWWSDSPGYRQHLAYGALRCIETRRDLARSANTGISAFIDQRGTISHRTGWWVGAVSRATVHLNTEQTFYVRYGELIGHGAQGLAVLGIIGLVLVPLVRRK